MPNPNPQDARTYNPAPTLSPAQRHASAAVLPEGRAEPEAGAVRDERGPLPEEIRERRKRAHELRMQTTHRRRRLTSHS
jgi:hypothetical protein